MQVVNTPPPEVLTPRDRIRNSLISFAKEHIDNWDSYADREFRSSELGFEFVSRQTTFESNTLTVSKATVPGLTLEQHAYYRANVVTQMPKLDPEGKITVSACPDFEGQKCII